MMPESPPIVKSPTRPTAKWNAVVARIVPPQSVASQLKIFTPVGIAMSMVAIENAASATGPMPARSEEHTSELQSPCNLVCRLLLEKKKKTHSSRSASLSRTVGDSHALDVSAY